MHRTIVVVLALGLAAACTPDEDLETVYDPCAPLTIAIAPDLDAVARLGVEGAVRVWARVLPTRMVIGTGARATDVLPVRFEPGDTFYRAIYWDTLGTISIGRDQLAPDDYALALAHELGHAFGLLHVPADEGPSIMNPGNLELTPTDADAGDVRARWPTCREAPPVPTAPLTEALAGSRPAT